MPLTKLSLTSLSIVFPITFKVFLIIQADIPSKPQVLVFFRRITTLRNSRYDTADSLKKHVGTLGSKTGIVRVEMTEDDVTAPMLAKYTFRASAETNGTGRTESRFPDNRDLVMLQVADRPRSLSRSMTSSRQSRLIADLHCLFSCLYMKWLLSRSAALRRDNSCKVSALRGF